MVKTFILGIASLILGTSCANKHYSPVSHERVSRFYNPFHMNQKYINGLTLNKPIALFDYLQLTGERVKGKADAWFGSEEKCTHYKKDISVDDRNLKIITLDCTHEEAINYFMIPPQLVIYDNDHKNFQLSFYPNTSYGKDADGNPIFDLTVESRLEDGVYYGHGALEDGTSNGFGSSREQRNAIEDTAISLLAKLERIAEEAKK